MASDAWLDFFFAAFSELGYPVRVYEVLTCDTESIDLAFPGM